MKQARVLTDSELRRLLAVVAQSKHAGRNRLALMLSHLAGLRVGEIAALTVWDSFDSDGKVREQLRLRAEITKGGHARVVFLNDKLRREIEKYQADHLIDLLVDAPLLMTQKRTQFSANTLCQLFGQLYRSAGLDGATSHSGRRWFITRLAHSGVSPKVIMMLAGHRNLTTTQRYIEVRDDMMKAAVGLL
ncbi:tyrosine-type recombinase/integrase [Agrobacterium pusense]|uniref:Site-specific integrase n=1 Tax=Agrobacterium pusense TaxID=648995 RepID=A0A6H0ZKH1_9HYPH|nr:site-specific integrase [Agrobacterium pusense]ANV23574.1 integrase [Rhizobium sp. S41]KGE83646.1 integrase [Rhizobium sp. H41]MDH2091161.1 site-specific integrase [Agrobacterium pusense]QIX21316.1 site-specific integrase [Agrobacterium pusense]QWW73166.1 site-specific integrase [Agrobacterium pusense]